MLMMLGDLQFQIAPFNATETTHSYGAAHVEKPVLLTRPPTEFVGAQAETWTIRANLFPERFGGEQVLGRLQQMVAAGQPQYMVRGDGKVLGWMVVETVNERSSYLDRGGRGRVIDVDISLRRAANPLAGLFFAAFSAVFAGVLAR